MLSVKELAKTEWLTAEKKRKGLTEEVARLKKSIQSAPLTRDQFVEMEKELALYLNDRGFDWSEGGQEPIEVLLIIVLPFRDQSLLIPSKHPRLYCC